MPCRASRPTPTRGAHTGSRTTRSLRPAARSPIGSMPRSISRWRDRAARRSVSICGAGRRWHWARKGMFSAGYRLSSRRFAAGGAGAGRIRRSARLSMACSRNRRSSMTVPPASACCSINLGTPDAPTTGAVRRYLAQFLSDPRVVEIPRVLLAAAAARRHSPRAFAALGAALRDDLDEGRLAAAGPQPAAEDAAARDTSASV